MAPMVAASDFAYRKLVRQYGCDLCYTQMLHAKNLVSDVRFRRAHLDFVDWHELVCKDRDAEYVRSQKNCVEGMRELGPLSGNHEEQGPLIVQLAGHDPKMLLDAAQKVLAMSSDGIVTGFDLNLGCPQAIARKGRYGAFLFEEDEELVFDALKHLRLNLPQSVKVSAKIRLPVGDDENNSALKRRIEKLIAYSGVDFITVHGRTLHENKTKVVACHLDKIRVAVEAAQKCRPGFPVVANGGVENYNSLIAITERTGATAVMSSEALLETPNLFSDVPPSTPRQQFEQQIRVARDYMELAAEHPPLPGVLGHLGGSFNIVRGHLIKFLHRYIQVHEDLRERLVSNKLTSIPGAVSIVDELVARYESDSVLESCSSSQIESSWYRRHWHVQEGKFIHQRNVKRKQEELSIDEKKSRIQERIRKLQERKLARSTQEQARLVQ